MTLFGARENPLDVRESLGERQALFSMQFEEVRAEFGAGASTAMKEDNCVSMRSIWLMDVNWWEGHVAALLTRRLEGAPVRSGVVAYTTRCILR